MKDFQIMRTKKSVSRFALPILFALFSSSVIASEVTYRYVGTVVNTPTGLYSSIASGTTITGTYTFNYGAADPSKSAGTVGLSPSWSVVARGGTGFGNAAPFALVFTSTATINGVEYNVNKLTSFGNESRIDAGPAYFAAYDGIYSYYGHYVVSLLEIEGYGNGIQYSSDGVPVLTSNVIGVIQTTTPGTYSSLVYKVTSLTSVPEPETNTMLLAGMAMLCAIASRARLMHA